MDSCQLSVVSCPKEIAVPANSHEKICVNAGESMQIIIGENSSLELIENISAVNDIRIDAEITLARNSSMKHSIIQNCDSGISLSRKQDTRLEAGSSYTQSILSVGARSSRNETAVYLNGENASADMNGAYIGDDRQVLDNYLPVFHNAKNCRSSQTYRGVLAGNAKGIFHGIINVAEGASGSNANQQSRALLLSESAVADNRPELAILNDDVACAHGAAIGSIDENALYYLMARGLSEAAARIMLVEGFVAEVFEGNDEIMAIARDCLQGLSA